jgi:uncharacterized membrane protein
MIFVLNRRCLRVHENVSDLGQRLSPLTVMPLGIFGSAVLCDIGAAVSGVQLFGVAGFYNMAAGLIVSFAALVIVLSDLVTVASGTSCREVVGLVSATMTATTGVFALVWSLRFEDHRAGGPWLLLVELGALAVGGVGVWFAQGVVIGRRAREPVQVWLPASLARRR